MKKVLFSIFFVSLMVAGAQAQKSSCAKSCTAKTASASTAHCTDANATAAAKLASTDPTIESRTCPTSGTVCYVRKEAGQNGSVSYVDLNYDAATNTFVNVSPVAKEGGAGCAPHGTSVSGTKTGCATPASGKAGCCATKGKSTTASATPATDGKPVKTSGGSQN